MKRWIILVILLVIVGMAGCCCHKEFEALNIEQRDWLYRCTGCGEYFQGVCSTDRLPFKKCRRVVIDADY